MPFTRSLALAALATCLVAAAGCSLALATDSEQCNVDADCTGRGDAFAGTVCTGNVCVKPSAPPDPKWGCIGKVKAPTAGPNVTYKAQFLDPITTDPVTSGLTIKLCTKIDTDCTNPIKTGITPDSMGWIQESLSPTFDGYLDIVDPMGTYVPMLLFMDLVADGENTDILLVPPATEASLGMSAGVKLNANDGVVLVRTADCTGKRTDGVSVAISAKGTARFYFVGGLPMTGATDTDTAGNAGFANVAPGSVTITGTVAKSHEELGKVTTLVRKGATTYQILRPTPTL
jgi:hypothetical protein